MENMTNAASDSETIKDLFQQQQVSLRTYFENQLAIQFQSFKEQISVSLQSSINSISNELHALNERTSRVEDYCYSAVCDAQNAKQQVQSFSNEFTSVISNLEDKIDRLEIYSRRENLLFFNIPQAHEESYEECAKLALSVLKDGMPEINWHQDDICRAHRIGKYNPRQTRPKPLIVRLTRWSDKLMILTRGREGLRKKGISVASDLTDRQRQTLDEHRQQGLHAYYKGSRLIVTGPLRGRNNYNHSNRNNREEVQSHQTSHGLRQRGNNDRVYEDSQWQNDDYQPWSSHHFPLLPQRHVKPSDSNINERSWHRPTDDPNRRQPAVSDWNEGDRDTARSTPPSPANPTPSPTCDQDALPGSCFHAESVPLPHSPPTPLSIDDNSDQVALSSSHPPSPPTPQSTGDNDEDIGALSPSPPTLQTTDNNDNRQSNEQHTVVESVTQATKTSGQDSDNVRKTGLNSSTTVPESTTTTRHNQSVGQKTSRRLRSASVPSVDKKRQMTMSETMSRSSAKNTKTNSADK